MSTEVISYEQNLTLGLRLEPTVWRNFLQPNGLVVVDHRTDNHFCLVLAERCVAVIFYLDHRACPENIFAAPIEDAKAIWQHGHVCCYG